jgi:hypothetical protein
VEKDGCVRCPSVLLFYVILLFTWWLNGGFIMVYSL